MSLFAVLKAGCRQPREQTLRQLVSSAIWCLLDRLPPCVCNDYSQFPPSDADAGESSVEEQMSEAKLWLAKLLIVIQTTHSAYFP